LHSTQAAAPVLLILPCCVAATSHLSSFHLLLPQREGIVRKRKTRAGQDAPAKTIEDLRTTNGQQSQWMRLALSSAQEVSRGCATNPALDRMCAHCLERVSTTDQLTHWQVTFGRQRDVFN